VHARIISPRKGQYVTISEHRPKAHRAHAEWTPSRLIAWAEKTGVFTGQLVTSILDTKLHPEQGYRSCLGIMRLAKTYPTERLENACRHACEMRTYSYKSLASILKHNLDQQQNDAREDAGVTHAEHANVRGADYYQTRSDRC
jgi:hypothetical protein